MARLAAIRQSGTSPPPSEMGGVAVMQKTRRTVWVGRRVGGRGSTTSPAPVRVADPGRTPRSG